MMWFPWQRYLRRQRHNLSDRVRRGRRTDNESVARRGLQLMGCIDTDAVDLVIATPEFKRIRIINNDKNDP